MARVQHVTSTQAFDPPCFACWAACCMQSLVRDAHSIHPSLLLPVCRFCFAPRHFGQPSVCCSLSSECNTVRSLPSKVGTAMTRRQVYCTSSRQVCRGSECRARMAIKAASSAIMFCDCARPPALVKQGPFSAVQKGASKPLQVNARASAALASAAACPPATCPAAS